MLSHRGQAPPPGLRGLRPGAQKAARIAVALAVAVPLAAVLAPPHARAGRPVLTVALDPGHGGTNLGAPGREGVLEKRFTLALCRMLRKGLERDGIRVVTTRERDEFLTLGERVRRANASGADVFLSVHANASPEHSQQGIETYVLARPVRDLEAQRAGAAAADPALAPEAMIARARARHREQDALQLASSIQHRLLEVRAGTSADRGVRQAPFDVLEGLAMPGVLVEMGFIDHPVEGEELLQPETMRRFADALADGIEDFAAARE